MPVDAVRRGDLATLYRRACLAELDAVKPGNVHRHAPGHGMAAADFVMSAEVTAPIVARDGLAPGRRVLDAVAATQAAVGQNTNLGILLLAVPLAVAARSPGAALWPALAHVLSGFSHGDAQDVFRAIAQAGPGGLGAAEEADVRHAPAIGLRQAMALAAGRDSIAAQYVTDYRDIRRIGLPALGDGDIEAAAERVYLAFAASLPDSHVARKFGVDAAQALMRRFARLARTLPPAGPARHDALMAFDAQLKAEGLNPGTSADLTVATLFAALILEKFPDCGKSGLCTHAED